ncbi:hypothetical protein [Acidisoma sp. 7E03]
MDLSPLTSAAVTLVSAIFAACAPLLLLKLNAMLKLNLDQTHRDAIAQAMQTALGLGLQTAQAAGDAMLAKLPVRNAALAAMVEYVKQATPEAVSHFGLTDEAIAQKAAAGLATALHLAAPARLAASAPPAPPAADLQQAAPPLANPGPAGP